jgi:hypothetical protein
MSGSIPAGTKLKISPRVYARAFGEEIVLLDFAVGEYFGLDPVGAEVWRGLEGGEELAQIAERVVKRYAVARDDAMRDIVHLVNELHQSGLLETT